MSFLKDMERESANFRDSLRAKLLYDPKDIASLVLLGASQFISLQDCNDAIRCFKEAIQRDPSNTDARFWLGFCLHVRYFEYEQAERFFSEALSLDPNRSDCLSGIAYILWDKGVNLEKSLSYLQKAAQISPDWPLLKIEMVCLFLNLGRFEEAQQEINKITLLLNQSTIHPENEVEKYYEKWITGRDCANLEEKIKELERLIVKHKENTKNQGQIEIPKEAL